jgi:hypothetical protein
MDCESWIYRFFGAEVKDEQEKADLERLVDNQLIFLSKFVISDYVPWLSFVPRLQGLYTALKEFSNFRKGVTSRIFEVEKHRERAKERQHLHKEGLTNYVPDFVDLLLASPQDNMDLLSDEDLVAFLTVTTSHISINNRFCANTDEHQCIRVTGILNILGFVASM